MDDPDLALCGLSIWVEGYQFPEIDDDWDGNWLMVRAVMCTGGARVEVDGPNFMTGDFVRFRDELVAAHRSLVGNAVLSSYEPNLKVALTAGEFGAFSGIIDITPDHLSQSHSFEIGFDQSYLPGWIAMCNSLLDRFPVRG